MDKKIKYIGHYGIFKDGNLDRNFSLAETNKMNYVCNSLVKLGYKIEIISPAISNQKGIGFVSCKKIKIGNNCSLILTPTIKAISKIGRAFRIYLSDIWLCSYLIFHCKQNEKILVYHHYSYAIPIWIAKKIRNLDIVLQIEEKYSMVWKISYLKRLKENILLRYAKDKSLIVSETLAGILNIKNPIISYGNYTPYKGLINKKGKNKNIKIIFTGSIDSDRNGGFLSVEAMKYLPSNYLLYISGTIAKKDYSNFLNQILRTNKELGREAIIYLGILGDEDYKNLLLSADIAMNPQKQGIFGSYVFPSKILTYMSFELPVVTTKGESIINSQVADLLFLVDGYEAKDIAQTIESVHFNNDIHLMRKRLELLDLHFCENLSNIL